jgi:hypothetical protein
MASYSYTSPTSPSTTAALLHDRDVDSCPLSSAKSNMMVVYHGVLHLNPHLLQLFQSCLSDERDTA